MSLVKHYSKTQIIPKLNGETVFSMTGFNGNQKPEQKNNHKLVNDGPDHKQQYLGKNCLKQIEKVTVLHSDLTK